MSRLFHFEHKQEPLATPAKYYNRLLRNIVAGLIILAFFLGIGVAGYHITCGFSWLDSLLNASMILSGMGPLDRLSGTAGLLFEGIYALVCGLLFFAVAGLILSPALHRLLRRFHLEDEEAGREN